MGLFKHTENKRIYYLVPLNRDFDGRPVFMDASDLIFDAIRADKANDYNMEKGPAFGIEKHRAEEYAEYVAQYATIDNLYRFAKPGVRFNVATDAENAPRPTDVPDHVPQH